MSMLWVLLALLVACRPPSPEYLRQRDICYEACGEGVTFVTPRCREVEITRGRPGVVGEDRKEHPRLDCICECEYL